jgi:hypothetical protein
MNLLNIHCGTGIKPHVLLMLFFILAVTPAGNTAYSQKVFGFDMTDPGNTEGFAFNNSLDENGAEYYVKYDAGMFDQVFLIKDQGFICKIGFPTSNRLQDVYAELERVFGVPELILDEIPEDVPVDDIDKIMFAVSDGRASIIRYWYEERYTVKLKHTHENLKVFISFHKS